MDEDIMQTKDMIKKQVDMGKIYSFGIPFSKYQKVYAFTNENIKGYMERIDFKNKRKALTVLASGDHVYNLLRYGVLEIDTFDTNVLTRYYALGLKKALILKYNYQEFVNIYDRLLNNDNLEELTSLILDIREYMDDDEKKYWTLVIDYNYHLQRDKKNYLNILKMLLINLKESGFNTTRNKYLENNESYQLMKDNLSRSKISYVNEDLFSLDKDSSKKYDIIFLSNILDYLNNRLNTYWDKDKLLEIYNNLESLINQDGKIAVSYFFNFYNEKSNHYINHPISGSNVTLEDMKNEIILKFPSLRNEMMDGLLIRRKR